MKKINLMYFRSMFFIKMSEVEIFNAFLSFLCLSGRLRLNKLMLRCEEKLMKKRQYMNTALKRYITAKIECNPEVSRKYILDLTR